MTMDLEYSSRDVKQSPGLFGIIFLLLLLAPLFWKTVSVAISDLTWSGSPEVALFFDGDLAKARHALALSKLMSDIQDASQAEVELKEALRRDPLAPSILSSLAKTYVAQRQIEKANAIWPMAARSTWRDGEAQSQAMHIAMTSRNYHRVFDHFDALMRVFPGQNLKIVAQIIPYLDVLEFRRVFNDAILLDPPWCASFLASLNQVTISLERLNEIYALLKRAPSPLKPEELRPYVKRLVANKLYDNAYLIWLGTLPQAMKPEGALLYNSDFQFPVSNMPFDWTFDPVAGIDMEIEKKAFARVLRVTFSHTRSRFQNVKQILFLSPGNYEFSGRESSDTISNERGVRWRIRCVNDADGALVVTPSLTDTIPWRDFKVAFSVPRSCPVQEILLEIPARTGGERANNGSVGYSGLTLKSINAMSPPKAP